MVEALEESSVALAAGLDLHATVRAGVHEDLDDAVRVAREDDRTAPDVAGAEVVGAGDFALVADEQPRSVEYGPAFLLEDGRFDQR